MAAFTTRNVDRTDYGDGDGGGDGAAVAAPAPAASWPATPEGVLAAMIEGRKLLIDALAACGVAYAQHKVWLRYNPQYATSVMENEEALREQLAAEMLTMHEQFGDPRRAALAVKARQWYLERTDRERWGASVRVETEQRDLTAILREAVARIPRPAAPALPVLEAVATPVVDAEPSLPEDVLHMLG